MATPRRTGPGGQLARLLLIGLVLLAGCSGQATPLRVVPPPATPVTAWPSAFGDAGHTSPTVAVGPQAARIAWQRELEGAVVPGSVVGMDGSILAASNGGVLHALDPATGQDRWTYDAGSRYGSDLSTSPAVLGDGTILWPGPSNTLYGLSSSGKLLWQETFDAFVLSPAVVDRRVYVADMAGGLAALDVPTTGPPTRAWSVQQEGTSYSSPAVGPDGLILVAADQKVSAYEDRGTKATRAWSFTAKDIIEVSLAVGPDGTVVVGTNNDVQYGLTRAGEVRWTFKRGDWTYSSAVVHDGKAYFGDHLGLLDVVDVATGEVVHRGKGLPKAQGKTSSGTGFWTAPIVDTAGNVYAGTAAGHVYGFGPDGGRLWDADIGGIVASYPALTAEGLLLFGSTNGTLYAFGDQ